MIEKVNFNYYNNVPMLSSKEIARIFQEKHGKILNRIIRALKSCKNEYIRNHGEILITKVGFLIMAGYLKKKFLSKKIYCYFTFEGMEQAQKETEVKKICLS